MERNINFVVAEAILKAILIVMFIVFVGSYSLMDKGVMSLWMIAFGINYGLFSLVCLLERQYECEKIAKFKL